MTAWDHVRSREAAEALVGQGALEPVLLVPAELGGASDPANLVPVPPAARADKDAATAALLDIFREGRADQLSVVPEYRGDSFVPAALVIRAWRETAGASPAPAYERRIAIW